MKRYGKNTCKTIVSFIYTSIKSLKEAPYFQTLINLHVCYQPKVHNLVDNIHFLFFTKPHR